MLGAHVDSFVYQYLVGGSILVFGVLCGMRTGNLSPRTKLGRRRLLWMLTGFLGLMALHASLLIWGP